MSVGNPVVMLLLMFGVFYLLIIRPQTKRQKEHQATLAALKTGDVIITRGGVIGKISGIKDDEVIIEVQERVRIRVLRSHIEGEYNPKVALGSKAA